MDRKKVIILLIATALTAFFVASMLMYFYMSSKERGNEILLGTGSYEDITKYMEISDLEKLIYDYAITEPTENQLVAGALKGMVGSLGDSYSTYYTEEEFKNVTASNEGQFVGIGISAEPVSRDNGYLRVRKIYGGSPAHEAGIVVGDIIMAVDSVNIAFIDFEGAMNLILGPSGSPVTLTVASVGTPAREIAVTRASVDVPSVSYSMLDNSVGLIVINRFDAASAQEFGAALKALIEEENATGVVIDVRGSVDGSIKAAVDVLDQLVSAGVVTYSIGRGGDRTEYTTDDEYSNVALSVAVNSATVGAAEIFAGAIKDMERGQVVGTTTFGKGVDQTVQNMPYSGGGVRITTAEYYTPSGRRISNSGIIPDVEVYMPEDGSGNDLESDPQIRAAKDAVYSAVEAG